MLPKTRRIQRQGFSSILSQGKRFASPHLLLYLTKGDMAKNSRFSVSISKKVSQKATSRNTYRRRAYSVISKVIKRVNPGFLCVLTFKKTSTPPSFLELEKEITDLLQGAGVLS
jgi:ribonuclease P protein component